MTAVRPLVLALSLFVLLGIRSVTTAKQAPVPEPFKLDTLAIVRDSVPPVRDSVDHLSVLAFPYFSASPESGFLIGAAGIASFELDKRATKHRRSSTVSLGGNVSELGRALLATNFDLYFNDVASRISGRIGYEKQPTRYYGIGATSNQSDEVWYYPTFMKFAASYMHRVSQTDEGQGFTIGGRLEYWNTVTDTDSLRIDTATFVEPLGWNGGLTLGGGFVLAYDTRDNPYFPTKNMYAELRSMTYGKFLAADYEYNRSWLDVRGYHGIHIDALDETMVIAGQALIDLTIGNAPIYDLPTYGGDAVMRGILRGRYIDRASAVAQVEVRSRLFWVLGLAAFAAAGDVFPNWDGMSLAHTKVAGGCGLRIYLNREAGMIGRIDVAWSEWGTAGYFTFGEAF